MLLLLPSVPCSQDKWIPLNISQFVFTFTRHIFLWICFNIVNNIALLSFNFRFLDFKTCSLVKKLSLLEASSTFTFQINTFTSSCVIFMWMFKLLSFVDVKAHSVHFISDFPLCSVFMCLYMSQDQLSENVHFVHLNWSIF